MVLRWADVVGGGEVRVVSKARFHLWRARRRRWRLRV